MHELCLHNGRLLPTAAASISLISKATFYGKGVFTTIGIYSGEPFLWQKHWLRLSTNARTLGIDLSEYGEAETRNALNKVIEANSIEKGRARITFFDESPSRIWSTYHETKTGLLITTADFRQLRDEFKLTVSPHRVNTTSPLAGTKSCNYLEHLLVFDEAKSRGFDEAIRLNELGEIASASMANVFWLKEGELFTPSLKTGCLGGTTREYVLENLECEQVEAGTEDLERADQIFLTSAGIGVAIVNDFDGRFLRTDHHPIMSLLPLRF